MAAAREAAEVDRLLCLRAFETQDTELKHEGSRRRLVPGSKEIPRGRFKKSEDEAVPKPSSTRRSLAEQLFPESEDEAVPKPSTIHDPIVIGSSQFGHDTQLSQADTDYGSDFHIADLTEPNPLATQNEEQKKHRMTESSQFGHDTQLFQAGSDYGSDFRIEDLTEPNPPTTRNEEQKKHGLTGSSQFGHEVQRSPPDAGFGSDFRVEDITELHAGDISETNPSSHRKKEQRNRRKVIVESSESEAEVDAERRSPLATRGGKKAVIESSESEFNAQRSPLDSDHDTDVLSDVDVVEASPALKTSKPSKKKKKKSVKSSDPYQSSSKHTRPSKSRRLKDIHSDLIDPPSESTGPRKHKAQPVLSSASLSELEVEMSPHMQNLKRWNTAIGDGGAGLSLLRVVLPTKMKGRITMIQDLLQEPVIDGRDFFVHRVNANGELWLFKLADRSHPGKPSVEFTGPPFDTTSYPTRAAASQAGDKICEFFNRLPFPPAMLGSEIAPTNKSPIYCLLRTVIHIHVDHERPANQCRVTRPNIYGKKNSEVKMKLPVVLIDDHGSMRDGVLTDMLNAEGVNLNTPVPSPTEFSALFGELPSDVPIDDKIEKLKIPSTLSPKVQHAANATRDVYCRMYGAIGTVTDLRRCRDQLIYPYTTATETVTTGMGKRRTRYGPYGDKKLFSLVMMSKNGVTIKPSYAAIEDVDGKLPEIRNRTTSKTKLAFILDHMLNLFYAGENLLTVWRAGCVAADLVISGALTSEDIKIDYCQCHQDNRSSTVHVCMGCFENEICAKMERNDSDCLVCPQCLANHAGLPSGEELSKPGAKMRWQLHKLIQRDKTVPKADQPRICREVWEHFQKNYYAGGCNWRDVWANVTRSDSVSMSPFAASIEGIYPVAVVDGKVVYHNHWRNTGICGDWINRWKRDFGPAITGLVRLAQDLRKHNIASAPWESLIDQFDHFAAITGKYKTGPKVRRVKIPVETARTFVEQAKRPVASLEEGKAFFKGLFAQHGLGQNVKMSDDWKPVRVRTMKRLIAEMEVIYGRTIQRSEDGAPWMFISHHMPANWSWGRLWRLFVGREQRMRIMCNVKWHTMDNAETLMLECVRQYLQNGGRDRFFGLPMTLFHRHPLCISIGHLHHGRQMRTGFTTLTPSTMADYDESLNNICFESQLTNSAKFSYPEDLYEDMLADALKVKTSTEYFHVPNECERFNVGEMFEESMLRKREFDGDSDSDEDSECESDNELEEGDI
ncbi:unnamed protein product [Zymoseptoria tritici ST99CH_1E4]|uniref:Uncharacterized protein n=1 Tax=Zymoseptoria tritici ST99CH_1E4 TaxID=1276532 RepID=A0A2H1GKZ2_ZYMTR|nr:unnamed protein product [Zymoseptoria tritici ST99CH_1E4]